MADKDKIDNPPAFNTPKYNSKTGMFNGHEEGMTLRDYFAAKAIQGMLAKGGIYSSSELVEDAYMIADKMLAARGEQK